MSAFQILNNKLSKTKQSGILFSTTSGVKMLRQMAFKATFSSLIALKIGKCPDLPAAEASQTYI